ncbi:MAG TPA: hypothetical protein VFR04_06225 [Solirubrobacterales bacterium]|nr:hypothetical protein [Solirubrobacterales bacterium]
MTRAATPRLALAAAIAATLLLALAGSADARPLIGKDGKIHACYRVKGKPRGELRVVKSAKAHCRRGERRTAWFASGAVGPAGAPGASGAAGHTGADGQGAAIASTTVLEEKVLALTERVKALEGVLQGVTNSQLLAAIAAAPVVETLCGEVTALVAQTNDLRDSVGSLVSTLSGSLLGAIFGGVGLPAALPETLTCPSA